MNHFKAILNEAFRDPKIGKRLLIDIIIIGIDTALGISLLVLALHTANTVLLVGAIAQILVGLSLSSYIGRFLLLCHKVVKQEKKDEIDGNRG